MRLTEDKKKALVDRLEPQISELEAVSDDIPFGLGEDDSMQLRAMKIALAALTAEPVSHFYHVEGGGWYEIMPGDKVDKKTPLYTAPPVSELRLPEELPYPFGNFSIGEVAQWNACIGEVKRLNGIREEKE